MNGWDIIIMSETMVREERIENGKGFYTERIINNDRYSWRERGIGGGDANESEDGNQNRENRNKRNGRDNGLLVVRLR